MEWFEQINVLIGHVAWPAAVVIIVGLFRNPLSKRIKDLLSVETPAGKVTFAERSERLIELQYESRADELADELAEPVREQPVQDSPDAETEGNASGGLVEPIATDDSPATEPYDAPAEPDELDEPDVLVAASGPWDDLRQVLRHQPPDQSYQGASAPPTEGMTEAERYSVSRLYLAAQLNRTFAHPTLQEVNNPARVKRVTARRLSVWTDLVRFHAAVEAPSSAAVRACWNTFKDGAAYRWRRAYMPPNMAALALAMNNDGYLRDGDTEQLRLLESLVRDLLKDSEDEMLTPSEALPMIVSIISLSNKFDDLEMSSLHEARARQQLEDIRRRPRDSDAPQSRWPRGINHF